MKVWFAVLKSLQAFLNTLPEWECKTVGYLGERAKWHCGTCTFGIIRKEVNDAVTFWSAESRYKDALS